MPMTAIATADRDAAGHIQGRKQRSDPVPFVVMRLPRPHTGASGRIGWVRFRACTWLFSSTQDYGSVRRFKYKPTISRAFSTNCGSLGNVKFSTRAWVIDRGAPRRGSSSKASRRSTRKRSRHLQTVAPVIFKRFAT